MNESDRASQNEALGFQTALPILMTVVVELEVTNEQTENALGQCAG
jgi:hypothetical protein